MAPAAGNLRIGTRAGTKEYGRARPAAADYLLDRAIRSRQPLATAWPCGQLARNEGEFLLNVIKNGAWFCSTKASPYTG
jgi:hypothetical protein